MKVNEDAAEVSYVSLLNGVTDESQVDSIIAAEKDHEAIKPASLSEIVNGCNSKPSTKRLKVFEEIPESLSDSLMSIEWRDAW